MAKTDNGMDAENRKQCSYFKHVAEYGNISARDGIYVPCVGIRIRSRIRNAYPIYEPVSDPQNHVEAYRRTTARNENAEPQRGDPTRVSDAIHASSLNRKQNREPHVFQCVCRSSEHWLRRSPLLNDEEF